MRGNVLGREASVEVVYLVRAPLAFPGTPGRWLRPRGPHAMKAAAKRSINLSLR